MGFGGSQVLHLFLLIFLFVTSFYYTHNLVAKASFNAQEYYFNSEVYYGGNNGDEFAGKQGKNGLFLGKFRVMLGLPSFQSYTSRNGHFAYLPPSSSPSPAPAWTTAPVVNTHRHAHPPLHYHSSSPRDHKEQKEGKGMKDRRILSAVFASVGVTSILCAIGLFFCCRKFKKQLKWRTKKGLSMHTSEARNKGKSKFATSQSSAKKVSSDPGPDLFYLDSLETALNQKHGCINPNFDPVKTALARNMSNCSHDESEESDKKVVHSEYVSGRCCSVVEITTVHEISESVEYKNEDRHFSCGERLITEEQIHEFDDKIITEESDSSDDESFHSFCNSCSPQVRDSNASAGSIGEFFEVTSQDDQHKESLGFKSSEISNSNPILSAPGTPHLPLQPPPPPPPPPPPSVPFMNVSSSPSSRTKSSLKPSTLVNFSYSKAPKTSPSPPLPPSLLEGNVNNPLKIPPPPPSQHNQHMPSGKDGSPLPKLKPLHWDKVRATPDRSTVWDKLRSSSFEFDEEMIESLFGYNLQNTIKMDEAKSKTPSPRKHVLDPKRLHNITILSKALNVTAAQVCGALIRGDGLSLQDLEALSKMVPTKEEEAKLSNYRGDVLELGSAEKLVKEMLKIPFAFARIEAMLYRETFEDEVFHLIKSFSMLEEACKELRSSRLFLKLLEAVLKTGNRMNIGTTRGGAKAFKLDTLLKLADVKGTDGKTTLLHFVVQEIMRSEGIRVSESIMGRINMRSNTLNIEDKEENYRKMGLDLVSGLSTELCNVKKTATIDLDVLASSVTNLSGETSKLQRLVQKDMIMEETKGNFVISMRSFLKYAETKVKELQQDENRVLLHVKEITEYFHGNVSKDESNPLHIFVIVRDFLSMLDHVCKELRSSKTPRSPYPLSVF
ncbi:formin-like protein 11 [Primulina huaijiensis]|uniref:formin-like protein 11 n=1 Tax=Primulina huaijiensis TaxID=1492673 RepID=UPI003CC78202